MTTASATRVMELVNNVLSAGCRIATLEVAAMGLKMGVPLEVTTHVLNGNSGRNRKTQLMLPAMVAGQPSAGNMQLAWLLKDVNQAVTLGMELGVPMSMTTIVRSLLQAGVNQLGVSAELSQMADFLGAMAGTTFRPSGHATAAVTGAASPGGAGELRVGYVGLGAMGGALARRLMQSRKVTVFDLRPDVVHEFESEGAIAATRLAALARACDVIFTNLPTSADVREAIFGRAGLVEGLAPGKVIIDQTTGDPTLTRGIAADLEKLGVALVDATVSGAPRTAITGTINMMAGGPAEAVEKVRSILQAITPNVSWCGASGNGHAAKLINHAVAAVNRLLTYEAVAMGFKYGLSLSDMSKVINDSTGWSGAAEKIIPALATDAPTANLALDLMVKDLQLATRMAIDCGAPMLVTNQARGLFETGANALGGKETLDAMVRLFENAAGIRFAQSCSPRKSTPQQF